MKMYLPALLAVSLLLLCGCPPKSGSGSNTGTAPANTVSLGGTVRLPLDISVDDPVLREMDFSEQRLWALTRAIGLPLMQPDFGKGKSRPGLATAAQADDKWQLWTFSLPDISGHENDPLWLGNEIKTMFKRIVNGERSPLRAEIMDLIEGAQDLSGGGVDISGIAVADNEIRISLTRPFAEFDLWLSQPGLSLADVNVSVDEAGAVSVTSSGYAAWRIDNLLTDPASAMTSLVLMPNPDSLVGQPAATSLQFVLEPDRAKQVELFRNGNLDAANIPATIIPQVEQDEELAPALRQHETAASLLVMFDHGQDPWGDQSMQDKVGLRQSLGLSISRESLEEENNLQVHGWGHFLPEYFRDAIPPRLLTHPVYPRAAMLEEARQKQKQSDHEQGSHLPQNMDVAFNEYDYLTELDRDLLQFWSDISIKLQPFPLSRADLRKRIELNSHEVIVFWNFPAWPSPDACLYPQLYGNLIGQGGNYSRIDNQAINLAIEQAQREPDRALRQLYYQKIGERIEEEGLFVPAAYLTPSLLIRDGLAVNPGAFDFNASLQSQDFTGIGFMQE
jgi:ABC-type transport system substrate-binding protein